MHGSQGGGLAPYYSELPSPFSISRVFATAHPRALYKQVATCSILYDRSPLMQSTQCRAVLVCLVNSHVSAFLTGLILLFGFCFLVRELGRDKQGNGGNMRKWLESQLHSLTLTMVLVI